MSFDQLLNQWIPIKYASPIRRIYCPQCGGINEMRETERGLKCIFCGWHESGGSAPKFLPRTPENTQG